MLHGYVPSYDSTLWPQEAGDKPPRYGSLAKLDLARQECINRVQALCCAHLTLDRQGVSVLS